MFGHHDDHDDKHEHAEPVAHDEHAEQAHEEHSGETANQVVHPGDEQYEEAPAEEPATVAAESASDLTGAVPAADDSAGPQDTDTPSDDQAWQHPGEPLKDEDPEPISDVIYPAGLPKAPTFSPAGANPAPDEDDSTSDSHQLIDIKVKALDELAPLIDDLDMEPEEKFRTIMMMIQAGDNQDLVEKAYAAAHSIEDEKARAQALLDVVNEINYFTQPHQTQSEI